MTPPPAATWREVDRLIDEQKLAEVAKRVDALEAQARAAKNDDELAKALVRSTQLGLALGGYESAVEALQAKEWPAAPLARATVELYSAHALFGYLDAYGWEIGRRERRSRVHAHAELTGRGIVGEHVRERAQRTGSIAP